MRFGLWPIDATYVKYSTFMSQVQYNIHITAVNYYFYTTEF